MQRLNKFIKRHITPAYHTPGEGIRYWQERILLTLLLFSVILGSIAWIPSVVLSIRESLWTVAVADTLGLGFIFLLFFTVHRAYTFGAVGFCLFSYLLGLILIATIGPFGAGPVWLFIFPVLTGLLLSPRFSIWALVINALTITFVGYLIHIHQSDILTWFELKTWHVAQENPVMKWGVICTNFMLLNILATASITTIVNGLNDSLTQLSTSEKKYREIYENNKELQDKLNRSQKMELLGTLAGGVAHDLNNVLSGIVTYPELLLMDQPEGSPMARRLKIIQKSGNRAMEIVQDLLTLSRRGGAPGRWWTSISSSGSF